AIHLLFASRKPARKQARRFFVDKNTFAQTVDVLKTRSAPIGVELVVGDVATLNLEDENLFGILVQNPGDDGTLKDYTDLIASAHAKEIAVTLAVDLMSLLLVKAPGEMGADVVVGSSQRFGVPMGFGGPHAAFFATREEFKRQIPGRIIGASVDASGNPGYRMALQTREQHIRRENATSNICTAQVLLYVIAGMYAVYHGPEGIRKIAGRVHALATDAASQLTQLGVKQLNEHFFDTLRITGVNAEAIKRESEKR